jgi:hypothetical protein
MYVSPTGPSTRLRATAFSDEVSLSHSETPHSVGFLWISDQSDAEISTWQHTILTTDRYQRPFRDSIPQSQEAGGLSPTP